MQLRKILQRYRPSLEQLLQDSFWRNLSRESKERTLRSKNENFDLFLEGYTFSSSNVHAYQLFLLLFRLPNTFDLSLKYGICSAQWVDTRVISNDYVSTSGLLEYSMRYMSYNFTKETDKYVRIISLTVSTECSERAHIEWVSHCSFIEDKNRIVMVIFSVPISFPIHFRLYISCIIKFIAKKTSPVFSEMELA